MSSNYSVPPFQPTVASTAALTKTQHSNRASPSPFPQTTTSTSASTAATTAADATYTSTNTNPTTVAATSADHSGLMAASGFLPTSQAFRHASPSQPVYPLNMSGAQYFDRERTRPVGTPFTAPSPSMARVVIRRLPLNSSEESLRLMFVFSQELVDVDVLPVEQSEDAGFVSAILKFRSMAGALEAKAMFDGRSNISKDAEMIVDVLGFGPGSARRYTHESQSGNPSSSTSSSNSSVLGSRQASHFNGPFQQLEKISPTSNSAFPVHDFPNPDASAHYQNLFSPQSPIGNHLTERTRITGKSLINNDFADDEETSDLLKDPVAYAENGAPSQRRATAPQIPISRMVGLSLNTTHSPGPSSLPPYMSPMSPTSGPPSTVNYPVGNGQHYQRHNFPPVNPADQNPPCNTLYVGNLPIDTSEEELKAMFSKQRGYKRLCFRTKQNGPMCFVEFEDVSFATKALHDLYGQLLHNSVKGGIRLSFSKNPLGVRSGQNTGQAPPPPMGSMNGMMAAATNGFTTANGPPPGLAAPPGLGNGRVSYNLTSLHTNGHQQYQNAGFPGSPNHPWNGSGYSSSNNGSNNGNNAVATGSNGSAGAQSNYLPRHMMGR